MYLFGKADFPVNFHTGEFFIMFQYSQLSKERFFYTGLSERVLLYILSNFRLTLVLPHLLMLFYSS